MSRRHGTHDAGMHAVARVRSVREQDSRVGLRQAIQEQRQHERRAAELRAQLTGAERFGSGSTADFLSLRASLDALGRTLRRTERDLAGARTISEAAYAHWVADRARLAAVETLLERRAQARRAEAARREARELDEIAATLWQRRRDAGGPR